MIRDFSRGATYIKDGFLMLNHSELRFFLLIPASISLVIFGSLTWISIAYLSQVFEWINNWLPEWLGFFSWLLRFIVWLMYFFFVGYIFTTVTLFFASPFNGLLAEKVEIISTKKHTLSKNSYRDILISIPKNLSRELSKLLHYLSLAFLVLVLSFIPFINVLTPVFWFLITAWLMSIHFLDYPMDNHGYQIREVRKFALSRIMLTIGFGSTVSVLAAIPVVNFFVMPSAVVGATLLWCDNSRDLKQKSSVK